MHPNSKLLDHWLCYQDSADLMEAYMNCDVERFDGYHVGEIN